MIRQPSAIVIGAGPAGLAAAYRLTRAGIRTRILERLDRPGGRVWTDQFAGHGVDIGAQFTADFYRRTQRLATELGIAGDLIEIKGNVAIPRAGEFYQLWTNTVPFTRLMSLSSKLRLVRILAPMIAHWRNLDLQRPDLAAPLDTQSMAAFARAQLSEEVLEYAFAPVLASLFYWTPERTSLAMFFLLMRAGLRLSRMRIFAFRHGMQQLPDALAERIMVTYGAAVREVRRAPEGGYLVTADLAGELAALPADGVVIATTADRVLDMLPEIDADQQAFFAGVRYSSAVIAAVEVRHRMPGGTYGILIPRRESRALHTVTIESARRPEAARPDQDTLMLFSAGLCAPHLPGMDDEQIHAALLADLRHIAPGLYAGAAEGQHRVYRWERALPEFGVGHLRQLARFASGAIERDERLVFAGDYLGGPFIETAIASGEDAADRLLARLERG